MKIPNWITDLTIKVLAENNCDRIPDIRLRKSSGYGYSGTTYPDHIRLRFGKHCENWEKKLLVLHELAHWIKPGNAHNDIFWELAFKLYKENGVPIIKAMKNEKAYKANALNGYRKVRGLKPVVIKRKNHIISRLSKLPLYMVIGLHVRKNKFWAVINRAGSGITMWFKGYRIKESLYNKLLKMNYEVYD